MQRDLRRVVFKEPQQATLEVTSFDEALKPDEALLRTHWSLISTGTELAVYTDHQDIGGSGGKRFPAYPGYAAMGIIEAVGSDVSDLSPGDRVMAATGHASLSKFRPGRTVCICLPDSIHDHHAPFIRMALICLATLRQADIRAGEWLGVVGLGLVGNLGAQFGLQAGFKVVGVGRSTLRTEVAAQCRIGLVLSGDADAIREQIRELTGDRGCRFVLDTSGTMGGLQKAVALTADGGAVCLVGVPWQSDPTVPATTIMQPVFSRYLTIQGGWEWGLPMYARDSEQPLEMLPHRHSIERNAEYALELIASGQIQIEPLITQQIAPGDIQEAYQGLLHERDVYLGVSIDWTSQN